MAKSIHKDGSHKRGSEEDEPSAHKGAANPDREQLCTACVVANEQVWVTERKKSLTGRLTDCAQWGSNHAGRLQCCDRVRKG